ncbi:MAG TPA: hypothetical protein VGN81_19545 [Pseudonocardiaceae bacterium]|jgi:cytochrome P450
MAAHDQLPLFPFDAPTAIDPPPQQIHVRETDPMPWVRLATGHKVRLVKRYADVRQTLSDPHMSRAALMAPGSPTILPGLQLPDMMLNMDPPDHTRLRPWYPRRSPRRVWSDCGPGWRWSRPV